MIHFNNVYFSYSPGAYAIKNINLSINKGEMVAVLGSNGAGKTTLVKHINGLLKPQLGSVIVLGKNTKEVSVAELARHVGLVFQNPDHQLFAETVEKEIMFALINFNFPSDEVKSRTEEALRNFDLIEYRDKSPFMLSGGEKKRLALASVLCYDPSIIILDEPTTGQDYNQKKNLMKTLEKLNNEGKTIIVVTHDIEFVADFIPRCIVMSNGEIVADGPSDEILTKVDLLLSNNLIVPQLVEVCYDFSINPPSIKFEEVLSKIKMLMKGEY